MSITLDGTAGITTSGTDDAAAQTMGGVAMPRMVLSTTQATTSGTNIDFTGIPSWVKRITVMFNGVSTNGTSLKQIQLGSGSITTTGYLSSATYTASTTNIGAGTSTTGMLAGAGASASDFMYGQYVITLVGSNVWIGGCSGGIGPGGVSFSGGGSVTLSGTLDRVRLTTVNGTDAFDAGSVNILYEG